MNAKALSGTSHLIGLLYFGKPPDYNFSDPFVAEIMNGVVLHTKKTNMFTLVHHISNRNDLIEIQKNWKFAGFIAVGFQSNFISDVINYCNSPIVFIDTLVSEEIKPLIERKDVKFVNNNDYELAKEATAHLLKKRIEKKLPFYLTSLKKICQVLFSKDIWLIVVVYQRIILRIIKYLLLMNTRTIWMR